MSEASSDEIKNGVNLTNIKNLIGAIGEDANLANVVFKARSSWGGSTKADVRVGPLHAGGQDIAPAERRFKFGIDEPAVLGGPDEHANPAEMLAAALCGCLTAGIATNAALFDVELEKLDVEVDLNFDVHGVLGLNRDVPSGPLSAHYKVTLKGVPGTSPDALRRCKETIDRKSPVRNALAGPLAMTSEVVIET